MIINRHELRYPLMEPTLASIHAPNNRKRHLKSEFERVKNA